MSQKKVLKRITEQYIASLGCLGLKEKDGSSSQEEKRKRVMSTFSKNLMLKLTLVNFFTTYNA